MTTKERIVDEAIRSRTMEGVVNVTLRKLAKALHMSHGNLEYHYATKEVLPLVLYQQMKKGCFAGIWADRWY
ncbi:MAG: TetR/AcrR family transcriptional regulator [Bacteroidota bacterium]